MNKFIGAFTVLALSHIPASAWTFDQASPAGMSTFVDGSAILHDGEGHIVSINIESGEQEWDVELAENLFLGADTAPGRLYANVCTGEAMQRNTYGAIQVVAIDTSNETILWKHELGGVAPWAQLAAGRYILAHIGPFLTALNPDSGEQVWRFKSRRGPVTSIDIDTDHVAVATSDGYFYVLAMESGEETWNAPLSSRTASTPLLDGEHVYTGAMDGGVFCFNVDSSTPLWKTNVTGGLEGRLAVDSDTLYFTTREGHIYALDKANGEVRWDVDRGRRRENATLFGQLVLSDDRLWVSTFKRDIIALSRDDGSEIARLKVGTPLVQFGISKNVIAYKPFGGQTLQSIPIAE